jgi:hypothetical protein
MGMGLTKEGRRGLAYVRAVSERGYSLSKSEFDAYVEKPERVLPKLYPAISKLVDDAVSQIVGMRVSEGENVRQWLVRVRWLEEKADSVRLTSLGKAVLEAAEGEERQGEPATEVVLLPTDELAYSRVLGAIAGMGASALIDPYLDVDALRDVVNFTGVTRILVGTDPARCAGVGVALRALGCESKVEARSSGEFHDRFVIGDDSGVAMLGTSLNGVGKRVTVMVRLSEAVAIAAVKEAFRKAWDGSTPLGSSAHN